jgi:5'-deoxynucleotidase YfbR-like HD superfamily hydrolase
VRTITNIRNELDRAIARRAELWRELGEGGDPEKSAQAAKLSDQIDALWAESRALRAQTRYGDASLIRARARTEERLEREGRRLKAA